MLYKTVKYLWSTEKLQILVDVNTWCIYKSDVLFPSNLLYDLFYCTWKLIYFALRQLLWSILRWDSSGYWLLGLGFGTSIFASDVKETFIIIYLVPGGLCGRKLLTYCAWFSNSNWSSLVDVILSKGKTAVSYNITVLLLMHCGRLFLLCCQKKVMCRTAQFSCIMARNARTFTLYI